MNGFVVSITVTCLFSNQYCKPWNIDGHIDCQFVLYSYKFSIFGIKKYIRLMCS